MEGGIAINIQGCLRHPYNKTKKQQGMHFVKFNTVSQMQNNVELITELLARPHLRPNDPNSSPDSPTPHARTHSSYYSPQHAFAIALETPLTATPPPTHLERPPAKNPETPVKRFHGEVVGKKGFLGMKARKASENNIPAEKREMEEEGRDLIFSGDLSAYSRTPKQGKGKERKGSCNLDLTTLFRRGRKDSENNSGPEKMVRREAGLVKKRSMGWDENNNFQFSLNLNSDDQQQPGEGPSLTQIPKINIRKQSDNDSPKKAVPSFLTAFKHHKNSLDPLDIRKPRLTIENFMIVRELGKGTFGRVVLAVERESRLMFAIKIISKREIRETNMVEQLIRELRIQLGLCHPNIVKLYGFFDDLLHFYTLMECALDGHLSDALKKRPPFSETEAATLMSQVCQVISHLHSQSVIHRDLKPENILFHEGVVKITDFGWSVRRDGRLRNTFCGTPVYLCPEILIGDDYDESVDIWTIGVILYEVIYRANPFRITCKEQLVNILNEPIHFDPRIDISSPARDFIQLCLKKRAAERPNIRELLLHEFLLKAQVPEDPKR